LETCPPSLKCRLNSEGIIANAKGLRVTELCGRFGDAVPAIDAPVIAGAEPKANAGKAKSKRAPSIKTALRAAFINT
jgi:hypothetical protein